MKPFLALMLVSVAAFGATWSAKMQSLSRTLGALVPDLVGEEPLTPAQREHLRRNARQLLRGVHGLSQAKPPADADPTIGMISGLFERELKTADRALTYGQDEYARRALRSATSYCIACHTRHDGGPQFPTWSLTPAQAKLAPYERGLLLAAMRQPERALVELESVIGDPEAAAQYPLRWGRAVRHAFTLAVRVKGDPERAERIVSRIEALPNVPALFQDMLPAWKKTVAQWKSEPRRTPDSEQAWYAETKRLYEAARATQAYGHDRSGDIAYLRFSNAAHELLTRYPQGPHAAEALLLAEIAYELLDDWMASPLPRLYFEACIRQAPHSDTAHQCFLRYEEDMHFGNTGSAGTFLTEEGIRDLRELRKLAGPIKKEEEKHD